MESSKHKTKIDNFIYDERIERMRSKTKTLGKLLRFAVEVCSGKHLGVGKLWNEITFSSSN